MKPAQLARLLAERMQEVVPAGITVEADTDGMLWFRRQGVTGYAGSYGPQWLEKGHGDILQRIREACWHALDNLQDFVQEETAESWPGSPSSIPGRTVLIDGGQLHLWYGDIEASALRLRPIPLESPLEDPQGD